MSRSLESIDKEVDMWNVKSTQVFHVLKGQLVCSSKNRDIIKKHKHN